MNDSQKYQKVHKSSQNYTKLQNSTAEKRVFAVNVWDIENKYLHLIQIVVNLALVVALLYGSVSIG